MFLLQLLDEPFFLSAYTERGTSGHKYVAWTQSHMHQPLPTGHERQGVLPPTGLKPVYSDIHFQEGRASACHQVIPRGRSKNLLIANDAQTVIRVGFQEGYSVEDPSECGMFSVFKASMDGSASRKGHSRAP